MRITLMILAALIVFVLGAAGAILIWDQPQTPPELVSVTRALDAVDFGDLPEPRQFTARDGASLVLRSYPGQEANTAILIHGATFNSASMHAVARALHARGATVYSLGMRGHEGSGRSGDVDYIGQLGDDLEDFMRTLRPKRPGEQRALVGFSAGGGFALSVAGSARGAMFDRFVLIAPALAYNAPTARAGFGGLVGAAMPRVLVLLGLNQLGITAFNNLHTTAFAAPADAKYSKTPLYSFRMAASFGEGPQFLDDLRRAPGSVKLLVGAADEVFDAGQYGPLLKPVRPDLDMTIMPGLNHMDMIVKPEALEVLADKTLGPEQ